MTSITIPCEKKRIRGREKCKGLRAETKMTESHPERVYIVYRESKAANSATRWKLDPFFFILLRERCRVDTENTGAFSP